MVQLIKEGNHIPDELFDEVSKEFSDNEVEELTGEIIRINSWNRANIAFEMVPGDYVSKRKESYRNEE